MNQQFGSSKHRVFHTGALSLLLAAGLLTGACGGAETKGSGGDATTGGGGSTSVSSSSGGGGSGGVAVNPSPCDPIQNDCVEAVASKCTISIDEDNFGAAECSEPLGDAQLGEECERPDGVTGHDTCAAGLFCARYGQPKSDPQTRVCRALCDPSNPCGVDEVCIPLTTNPYGLCVEKCEPFTDTCGADPTQACTLWETLDGDKTFFCGQSGTKKVDEACVYLDDCEKDHVCWGADSSFTCRPLCSDTHLCEAAGEACLLLPGQEDENGFGHCRRTDDSCLGTVVWEPAPEAAVLSPLLVVDIASGAPKEGALVKVCAKDDAMCAAPLDQVTTDATGTASVTVPTPGLGFDGYFEVTAPGVVPTLVFLNAPISAPAGLVAPVGTKQQTESLFVGAPVADASRGLVIGFAYDCAGVTYGGVSFSIDTADASTLLGHALPSFAAPTLIADAVDPALTESQAGGFMALNVPVGKAVVTAKSWGGATLGQRDVWSRAGASSVVNIEPAPAP